MFFYSIIAALFVLVPAALVGFPIFRFLVDFLKTNYFLKVLVSGTVSAIATFLVIGLILIFFGFGGTEKSALSVILLFPYPFLIVSSVACIIYWAGTKNLNNKIQNSAADGSDATTVAPV
jgi:hypothetical protein